MGTTKKAEKKSHVVKSDPVKDNKKTQIAELLNKLASTTIQREKKAIRRTLRALGHFGGLKETKVKA